MEIVPNFFEPYKEVKGKPVNLRSDLHFDMEMITHWCQLFLHRSYVKHQRALDVFFCGLTPSVVKKILFHPVNVICQLIQGRPFFTFKIYFRQVVKVLEVFHKIVPC